jgi:5-deoxy-D-glucuronate isomerase
MPEEYFVPRTDAIGGGAQPIADYAGIRVRALKLAAGARSSGTLRNETAWLLMSGRAKGTAGGAEFSFERRSLFDESASCVHASAGTAFEIEAIADTEFTIYECANAKPFDARVFSADDVPNEHRGAGQVAGRCLRFVRTIFDGSNSPADAELVLGEVVTLPGGWSSYPPHHHRQPEIYHYRFSEPQGYGHAELGEKVYRSGRSSGGQPPTRTGRSKPYVKATGSSWSTRTTCCSSTCVTTSASATTVRRNGRTSSVVFEPWSATGRAAWMPMRRR